MIRVVLPAHLRRLAGTSEEIHMDVEGTITQRTVLDALETRFPALRGTIRDHATLRRRAFVRFYVGSEDVSHDEPDAPLPPAVGSGDEPLRIVGAMAGG